MTPPDDPAMRAMLSDATAKMYAPGEAAALRRGAESLAKMRAELAAARAEGRRDGLEEAAGIDKSEIPGWMDTPMATGWVRGRAELRAAIRARIEETT